MNEKCPRARNIPYFLIAAAVRYAASNPEIKVNIYKYKCSTNSWSYCPHYIKLKLKAVPFFSVSSTLKIETCTCQMVANCSQIPDQR